MGAPRAFLFGLIALLPGCSPGPQAAAREQRITVFAASSLSGLFEALGRGFARVRPGAVVAPAYGASSTLRAQIEHGAPADIFVAADFAQMQPLVAAQRVEAPVTFATNRLAVAVPLANPARMESAVDLARSGVRLATASEGVPIARYTTQLLERLQKRPGYPRDFARRVRANIVTREPNAQSIVIKVQLGEVDAAVVYQTEVRFSEGIRSIPIPEDANIVVEYPIAVVAGSTHRQLAEQFIRFVFSGDGQFILRRFGLQ
jgi:molybdate transport system substrate-binding protein